MRVPIVPQAGPIDIPDPPATIDAAGREPRARRGDAAVQADADRGRSRPGAGGPRPGQQLLEAADPLAPHAAVHVPRRDRPDQRLRPLERHRRPVGLRRRLRRPLVHARPWSACGRACTARRSSTAASTRPTAPITATSWSAPTACGTTFPGRTPRCGFNVEQRLVTVYDGDQHADRAVLFGRYVFKYGASLYLPPIHYVETFVDTQDNFLPIRTSVPGRERFDAEHGGASTTTSIYLTPYWDPEGGFQLDATYQAGVGKAPNPGWRAALSGQSSVKGAARWSRLVFKHTHRGPDCGRRRPAESWRVFCPGRQRQLPRLRSRRTAGQPRLGGQPGMARATAVRREVRCCRPYHRVCATVMLLLFSDVGDALTNSRSVGPVAYAVGAGLHWMSPIFSFVERTTVRFDVAKAVNVDTGWQFWLGFTQPF